MSDVQIIEIDEITPEQIARLKEELGEDGLRRFALVQMAKQFDTPEAFAAYYELRHGHQPLPYIVKEFIIPIYEAKEENKGALIFAYRGSWKTTTITITFTEFRIGKDPERANLIIGVNDESAELCSAAIADGIENSDAFRMVFPQVVPDKEKGWGAEGYEVKRTDIDKAEWSRINSARKDPTLLAKGYKSGSVIGKHPDGVLAIDDIHDEGNTISERERRMVIKKVTGTIFPTIVQDENEMRSWNVWVGTPWTEDDAYHYVRDTGEFRFTNTPLMREVTQDYDGAVEIRHDDYLNGWYVLTSPDRFGPKAVIREYNKSGKREFARMYMLDLEQAQEDGLRYHSYPSEMIDYTWPAGGGCDYASIMQEAQKDKDSRSYFAHLYGVLTPQNQIVVVDGVVERCTQLQAEKHLARPQVVFKNFRQTAFEADGKGEEALAVFLRNPGLYLMPVTTKGVAKTRRHEIQLAPWLEMGAVRISDADTPALNHLRSELRKWPHWRLDATDALTHLLRIFPEALVLPDTVQDAPTPHKKEEAANPYVALAGA